MANTLITPTMIAREALMQLENNLVMGANVHRDYKKEFVKVGDTVNIRRPVKFDVVDGAVLTKQDVEEANTNIVIDQRKHVGWGFTTQDLTLTIEEYSERYILPAMIALANKIDRDLTSLYDDVPNWVGTPGQVINSYADFALAPQRMTEGAVPMNGRKAVLSPADHWGMAGSQTALFFNSVGEPAYRSGSLGRRPDDLDRAHLARRRQDFRCQPIRVAGREDGLRAAAGHEPSRPRGRRVHRRHRADGGALRRGRSLSGPCAAGAGQDGRPAVRWPRPGGHRAGSAAGCGTIGRLTREGVESPDLLSRRFR